MFKWKWLDGNCRHFCFLCKWKKQCLSDYKKEKEFMNPPVADKKKLYRIRLSKRQAGEIEELKREVARLKGINRELTRQLDDGERTCHLLEIRLANKSKDMLELENKVQNYQRLLGLRTGNTKDVNI